MRGEPGGNGTLPSASQADPSYSGVRNAQSSQRNLLAQSAENWRPPFAYPGCRIPAMASTGILMPDLRAIGRTWSLERMKLSRTLAAVCAFAAEVLSLVFTFPLAHAQTSILGFSPSSFA